MLMNFLSRVTNSDEETELKVYTLRVNWLCSLEARRKGKGLVLKCRLRL
jgi:hypothetical protein